MRTTLFSEVIRSNSLDRAPFSTTERAAASLSLVKIGPAPVVPGMIDALRDPRVTVRANAAVVLGAFGPAGKPAVPALVGALKDANARVRELAIEALNRVESTGPIPVGGFPLNCH